MKVCSNSNCRKERNGEDLQSSFWKSFHYVSWRCKRCGTKSWKKTRHFSSGIH